MIKAIYNLKRWTLSGPMYCSIVSKLYKRQSILPRLEIFRNQCSKQRPQCSINHLSLSISLWVTTCWKQNLVLQFSHKTFQKWLKNLASLSLTMVFGMPCNLITSQMNRLAMLVASSILLHRMKYVILLNLSTTTKMLSWCLLVFCNPRTKSMLMSIQGLLETSKGA